MHGELRFILELASIVELWVINQLSEMFWLWLLFIFFSLIGLVMVTIHVANERDWGYDLKVRDGKV